ncbi:C-C motif chemokine 20 isoform X1 [Octodon degus]|uniref:C-C motif chemokine n=1 Tax=Octodon degus TaxID=10160 RepID=A0A6P6F380_OCTDE|nr:C-C motif chemokine 20 isoform X1 [Octodon degus]
MMCGIKRVFLAASIAMLLLHFCIQSEAASSFDCCLGHRSKPLPIKGIRGFTEQRASETCDINAIIFHMRSGHSVCADPKSTWVKRAVRILSQRVKKM